MTSPVTPPRQIDLELHDALIARDMELAWDLVSRGADLEAQAEEGRTAFLAVSYHLAQDVEALIAVSVDLFTAGVNVEAVDERGRGFARYAEQNSSVTGVYLAVAFGIDTSGCLRNGKPMSDMHAEAASMSRLEAAVTIANPRLVAHLVEHHGEDVSVSELERLRGSLGLATEEDRVAVRDLLSAFSARRAAGGVLEELQCIRP